MSKLHLGMPRGQPAQQRFKSERQGHSVGEQLATALGDRYSIAWLAQRLGCDDDTAATMDGYWIVANPHGRVPALAVFGRMHGVELSRLLSVFAEADRASEKPTPAKQTAPASVPRRLVTIGSNDGMREIRQAQPKIEWRRQRVVGAATA